MSNCVISNAPSIKPLGWKSKTTYDNCKTVMMAAPQVHTDKLLCGDRKKSPSACWPSKHMFLFCIFNVSDRPKMSGFVDWEVKAWVKASHVWLGLHQFSTNFEKVLDPVFRELWGTWSSVRGSKQRWFKTIRRDFTLQTSRCRKSKQWAHAIVDFGITDSNACH